MELKVSPEKPGFSSSDVASDPEDKVISEGEGEDEDDDRNHKHRRREARSHSLEEVSLDQGLTRPYRKRNRPFENGFSYKDGDRQAVESRRNYGSALDRDFHSRFEKRRLNQGLVRGRGRELISWGIRDSILGLVDIPSQVVQPGYIPSALYAGRGFPSVSNTPSTSWNAFGLVPGIPNGGLDPLHPLSLPGALMPPINSPMTIGIPRQRCRDFEERGFCLRGDMCPMEHGVNRIVVDDVQSLSQFNLPVALPGSQLLGTSPGQGALPLNNKSSLAKIVKPGMSEDVFVPNGGLLGGASVGPSDVYDPDQPLWTNNDAETSAALRVLNQSAADGIESSLDVESSDLPKIESNEGFNEEPPLKNATNSESQVSSVWGRVGGLKRKFEAKEKIDSVGTSSGYLEQDIKSDQKLISDVLHQGKQMNVAGNSPPVKESSLKQQSDYGSNLRRLSQKALRTVFVSGIPLKDNRREALISHFQKFGQVIDVYTPANSERAFVQFSKREEAEAALKAPDAVMGNRFIKLWWANRDNIPDDRISVGGPVPVIPHVLTSRALSHPFACDKGQENPLVASAKEGNAHASIAQLPVHDRSKPIVGNGPKAPPPQQKKLENLELLKEQLRKKQEMLDQKRSEFRNMLDKLEKQAVGSNDVTVTDPSKRLKGERPPNHAKAESSKSLESGNIKTKNATSAGSAMLLALSANVPAQEPFKPAFRPPALSGSPFTVNRFKLDNRPTTFRITSLLPAGLANVAALEEHFSAYGELSSVELEESQHEDTKDPSVLSNVTARISFTTRHFAEKAYLHGKSWQGHTLQFTWLKSVSSGKEGGSSGKVSDASNVPSDANAQAGELNAPVHYEKTAVLGSDENEGLKVEANVDSPEQGKDLKSASSSEEK